MEGEIDGEGHESSVAASFCARSWEEGEEEGGGRERAWRRINQT